MMWIALAVAVVFPLISQNNFMITIINLLFINSLAAMGLNLIMGYAGQLSIGHAAFMSVGAYTSAILVMKLSFPLPLAMLMAILVSAILSLALGGPSLRLSGFYLAIVTMGFVVAVEQLIGYFDNFTGGHIGIRGIPSFGSDAFNYYVSLFVFIAGLYITQKLVSGRTGRAFRAIRENEIAAQSMGVNVTRYKILNFAVGSMFAGIAGSLYAHTIGYISPSDFGLSKSLDLLAMVIIGGAGTIVGPVLGAFIYTVLPFFFSRTQFSLSIIFGVLLIVVVLFMPRGLAYYFVMIYYRYFERPLVWFLRKYVKIDGKITEISVGKVHYVEKTNENSSSNLVFVHGNWASWRWFKPVMELPYKKFNMIAVDLPGFGASDKPKRPISIENYANELIEFLENIRKNDEKFVLVGHSLGAAVVVKTASKKPEIVERIVLVAPSPVKGYKTPEESYPVLKLYQYSFSMIKKLINSVVKDKKLAKSLTIDAIKMDPRGFVENPRALAEDLSEDAKNIKIPVFLMYGDKDPLITLKEFNETESSFESCSKVVWKNRGHCIQIEDPEKFLRDIKKFLEVN
jgi:branched-chain amino acid transport system permease protein